MDENKYGSNLTPEELEAKMKAENEERAAQSAPPSEEQASGHQENQQRTAKGVDFSDYEGEDVTGHYPKEDIEKNKVVAAVAYLIFFLPLIAAPDSKFGRFHANQGLVLLIVGMVGNLVLGMIPILGWILLPLYSLAIFVLAVLGLVNTLNGKAKKLPIIGKINLINK
jgi:uncharacterized membrane protein